MENNEINLYYEEKGNSNEEMIIFLHSNLLSNWIWKNQRNSFENYHCIYLDLPNHGNSYYGLDFSIEKSARIIKDLIKEKSNIGSKTKKVHLVGISVGGQIILYLLAKYPELIDTAIVTGVNIYEKPRKKFINEIIAMLDRLKLDILDKKSDKFLIKALLAEYGLEKQYYDDLKESTRQIINNNCVDDDYNHNLNNITKKSLEFKIPKIEYSENNSNDYSNLLILYGTKEYPKIQKSANLIKNSFKNAKIFSVYRSIHLWNVIDYEWFNEIVKDFIANKNLDLNEKPYLKRED
ncbi:alpha/beta fold hydrolase [Methanobrevibacter sp. TMH8]|uniref:alpha/beta hydrolase n=1 Tax=Methanobrevibacter sp. TMH8 TaxID=2848611 RepID=UPI001CD01D90|nr:alpha/beta hydrolase [Methanobrevibacter sp. TMH8]MBZ9571529.1 alpha/beta fold hydrolase [Methanobrevibacter sp. TMH8]